MPRYDEEGIPPYLLPKYGDGIPPHIRLRRVTVAVNVASSIAMLLLKPHPFYLAAIVSMFGRQSLQGLILPFLIVPPAILIGCIVFSTRAASRGRAYAPAIAALPLLAAAAWQLYAWLHPNG